ncbi:MAG TPA: cache domain-containing protein [Syntrophales bacterium]|nr:cache domain-containing protein [Syntrophales bacterium]HOL59401.1 cache domain-containing protein [Syntrophales bacterium]HPO35558.1 cache domain-containing protein [Syntrophales bacterium]
MTEKTKDKQQFTVARVFFLLIVIPLSLMAILIANGIFKLGVTVKERAVTVLDQKSQEEIKIRAINLADEVANFLSERKKDVLVATIIPTTEAAFKRFVGENRKGLWVKDGDKIRQVLAPLYSEMSYIDKNGNEIIKIANGEVVSKDKLANVANPAHTTYKSENYFAKAKELNKGEVYVSPLTGWYVSRPEFEQGKRFNGVIRFATPIYGKDGLQGIVQLALDARHLMAFTDHVVPTSSTPVFEADAASGNYAYMVDYRGYVISHPNDYHIVGLDKDGSYVPYLTQENSTELSKAGKEVLNFNYLGFLDPNLPEIHKEASAGKPGMKVYKFGGHTKFVAYAPIKFYGPEFPAGYGWIGMGVDVEKFSELAIKTSQNIDKEAKAWTTTIILILIISIVLLFLIAAILARGIARSIAAEVPPGAEGEGPFYDDEEEEDSK